MVAIETTKCPQCDARVRNDAVRCPRCRHRLRTRRVDPVEAGLVGAILLLVGIGTAGMISGSDDPDTANASSGGSGVTVQGPTRDTAKARVSLKPPTIPTKVVLNDAKVAPIAATIRTHWTLRAKGDEPSLKQAFGLYTGQLVGAGEAKWIRDIRKDGRLRIRIYRIWVDGLRGDHASAVLKIRTASTGTGCRNHLIRYDMVDTAAGWRMNASRAKTTACPTT
jgi:hypothetical protein